MKISIYFKLELRGFYVFKIVNVQLTVQMNEAVIEPIQGKKGLDHSE